MNFNAETDKLISKLKRRVEKCCLRDEVEALRTYRAKRRSEFDPQESRKRLAYPAIMNGSARYGISGAEREMCAMDESPSGMQNSCQEFRALGDVEILSHSGFYDVDLKTHVDQTASAKLRSP